MNGEGINYKLPEGAILNTVQCRAITKRRGLDRRCLHRTQRGIYCHQHEKVKRGLRITESETGEFGDQGQLGVFTTKPIKKGQIICDFTGKKVVADEEYDNPFGLWVRQHPPTFLDARRTTENGEGRFVQDGGDENNAEIVYNARGGIGQLKAMRNIAAGEEILADRNDEGKVDFIVSANIGAAAPKKKKLVRQSVSDAYADLPEPEPAPWVPPPAPMENGRFPAVPRPAAAPRPVAPQPRPAPRRPVVQPDLQRKLTVKEKRFRLWILAMQKLYEDEAFAKEKKVKVKSIKIPVPAYDATESVLYNEQTMQQAAWDALKPFSKWLKISEAAAEEIVKDYIKRKRLQIGKGIAKSMPVAVPKGALIYQGALGGQHG